MTITKTAIGNYLRKQASGDVGMYRSGFKDGVAWAQKRLAVPQMRKTTRDEKIVSPGCMKCLAPHTPTPRTDSTGAVATHLIAMCATAKAGCQITQCRPQYQRLIQTFKTVVYSTKTPGRSHTLAAECYG